MKMNFRIEPKDSYLYVSVGGSFEARDAQEISRQFFEACIEHQRTKVLIDVRSLGGEMSMLERWDYSVAVARMNLEYVTSGSLPPLQLAYVASYPILDPNRFGETVALNRGVTVKVTDNFQEAMTWLGLEAVDPKAVAQGG
jgi:hypothetical protein